MTKRLAIVLAAALAACSESEPEVVLDDRIVVAAAPEVWERLGPRMRRTLEPTPFALPDAQAFELTVVDPASEAWEAARRARQILLIGSPEDAWIADAIDRRNLPPPAAPSQTELANVWASGQHVLLLVPGARPLTERQLSDMRTLYDRRYRESVIARMYFPGGPDQALADTLQARGGFQLLVPKGYRMEQDEDTYVFRPPEGDSTTTARPLLVAWVSPIPEQAQGDARAVLEWRRSLAAEHYGAPQTTAPGDVHGGPTTQRGSRALQLLGSWRAGRERGPFLTRAVLCPNQDRMYLLDGWMSAADGGGQEQMVQIESILNSFRCGTGEG